MMIVQKMTLQVDDAGLFLVDYSRWFCAEGILSGSFLSDPKHIELCCCDALLCVRIAVPRCTGCPNKFGIGLELFANETSKIDENVYFAPKSSVLTIFW